MVFSQLSPVLKCDMCFFYISLRPCCNGAVVYSFSLMCLVVIESPKQLELSYKLALQIKIGDLQFVNTFSINKINLK